MMRIGKSLERHLQFFGNYPTYRDYLLKLDAKRFRGLGEEHTLAFIRRGVEFSQRHQLQYRENVEYVLFIMTFIGSNFDTDPRYRGVYEPFTEDGMSSGDRIDKAASRFQSFARQFIGERYEILHQAISAFTGKLDLLAASQVTTRDVLNAFSDSYKLSAARREFLVGCEMDALANISSNHLGLDSQKGPPVCLGLSLWLGVGFAKDPLFPWARDIIHEIKDPGDRTKILLDYAAKRLQKMLPEEL